MPFPPTDQILEERQALAQAVFDGRQQVQAWPQREREMMDRIHVLNGVLGERDVPIDTEPGTTQQPTPDGGDGQLPANRQARRAKARTAKKAPPRKSPAKKAAAVKKSPG